jgi:hypothetical protein
MNLKQHGMLMDEAKEPIKKSDHFSLVVAANTMRPAGKADYRRGAALLVKWTLESFQPIKIVEDKRVCNFCTCLNNS